MPRNVPQITRFLFCRPTPATTSSLLRAHYPSVIKEIGSDCTVTWYRWHRLPVCSCQAAWTTLRLEPATRMCSTRYPILFSRLEGHSRASRSFSFPRLHTVTAPGPQWGAACACTAREIHDARSAHWRIVLAGISRANLRPAAHAHSIACCTRSCASLLRPQPRPSDARGGICDFGGYAPITASHCVGEMPVDGRKGMRVLSLTTSPA
jgi:hypothetical protein